MKRVFTLMTACCLVMAALAANHYVSAASGNDSNDGSSWAKAMKTVSKGFSACATGDTLFVAAGTYNERVTITTGRFVSILGGYDAATGNRDPELFTTVIDGAGLGKCLLKAEKESDIPLLFDGLTLINADYSSSSSAMFMRGNMTLNNCIIRNCHSGSSGGAIYVEITDAAKKAVISNCLFESCSAAGGGGAIYNKGASIENCIFRGCQGVYATIYNKSGNITNCVFHNNAALDADWPNTGGVYNPGGTITNCTFANNWGTQYAGIHSDNTVYNSVFWGNKAEEGFTDPVNFIGGGSSANNIADQGFGASGAFLTKTLSADNNAAEGPHFVAPTSFAGLPKNAGEIAAMQSADFSIEKGSYLIDKGKDEVAPATDLTGLARPKGSHADVGAYEYDPNAAPVALESIDIYQDTLFVHEESMDALTVIFTPRKATNKSLNWSIDNTAVATIDANGGVTGVKTGTTVARAVSVDGGHKDTAVIVVLDKLPVIYPKEVLEADEKYKIEDYTIPSFMPFWVAKEAARVDSFLATDAEKLAIKGKIEAMYAAAEKLVPKTKPYNMVANINGDPATRMAFAWFTNEGINDGKVQLLPKANATTEDFENAASVIVVDAEATTTSALRYAVSASGLLKATGMDGKTAFKYVSHKAIAENLTPGTTYSWRVGYQDNWSPVAQFTTKEAEQGEFSFLYMSDSHIQNEEYVNHARWCATAAAKTVPDARFCVFPGDFVETGTSANSEWEWERWFEESINPVIMQMPIVPTDGNHDDSPNLNYDYHFNTSTEFAMSVPASYRPQFHGITYSFVYGDVLFLVYSLQDWWRSSSGESSMASTYLSTDVKRWFKEQIAKYPNTKYRVTLSHKNIFSGSGHSIDGEIPLFRDIMLPVIKECEIDLAIQGHDHTYEVIGPVDPDTKTVVEGAVQNVETVDVNTSSNMTGKKGGEFITDDGTLYFIGATCGRKRYYPYSRAEMEEKYTTDPALLFDDNHHNVENYFDLFTGMFGQPGAPSFSKFTVTDDGIIINSYKADDAGEATLFNTMKVVRTKPHSVPAGFEHVEGSPVMQDGKKFIQNGQMYIMHDGKIYDMLGARVK